MALFDVILLIILFGFILFGAFSGLIQALGALIGVAAGAWFAGLYYEVVSGWLMPFLGGQNMWAKVIAYMAIFIIVNRLVGLIFFIIGKVFNIIAIIPFLKTINRLLGAILGLIEGVLVIGMFIYVCAQFNVSPWLNNLFAQSQIAGYFVRAVGIIQPLIPDTIGQLQGYYEKMNLSEILKSSRMKEYNDMLINAAQQQ